MLRSSFPGGPSPDEIPCEPNEALLNVPNEALLNVPNEALLELGLPQGARFAPGPTQIMQLLKCYLR